MPLNARFVVRYTAYLLILVDIADLLGLFKMSVEDPQCRQIFFGASGSARYVGRLNKHLIYAEKIKLIQRGAEDTSLANLGMGSVTFPQVFDCLKGNTAICKNVRTVTKSSVSIPTDFRLT